MEFILVSGGMVLLIVLVLVLVARAYPGSGVDQTAMVAVFDVDEQTGRSSLTNKPQLVEVKPAGTTPEMKFFAMLLHKGEMKCYHLVYQVEEAVRGPVQVSEVGHFTNAGWNFTGDVCPRQHTR